MYIYAPFTYHPFYRAASHGQLLVLKYLIEIHSEKKGVMIEGANYRAFREAASHGHLDILRYLAEQAPDKLQEMIRANNYDAFHLALINGQLSILKYLEEQAPDELQEMIEIHGFVDFETAAANGHVSVLSYLIEKEPNGRDWVSAYPDHSIFILAATQGNIPVLRYLVEIAPDLVWVEKMITAYGYSLVRWAFYGGHVPVLRYLKELAPSKMQNFYIGDNYRVFHESVREGKAEIIDFLLSDPDVFAHAEAHTHGYENYTAPFINRCLTELECMRATGEPILITPEQARHFFYLARAIIRHSISVKYLEWILGRFQQ